MSTHPLNHAQAATAAALRLTPRQRVCLAAIEKHTLERCRSGYRIAFSLRAASFQAGTVQSLVRAGLAVKRDRGLIVITDQGRAMLALPYEPRPVKPENAPSALFVRKQAAARARYQSTTKPRLPYADN